MLVFMCKDPGETTSKVSCCVQTSYCFKYRDFCAIVKVPVALPLKMSLPENETTINLKGASFVVILHEGLTHNQSQIKPRLLSGESFTLKNRIWQSWSNTVGCCGLFTAVDQKTEICCQRTWFIISLIKTYFLLLFKFWFDSQDVSSGNKNK